mmetsp:Transcript_43464/g.108966  ORF Transcript_43464/g.108966 Transcript_43464/m.108966 type:complete len:282 (-) Transcript_43464:481-1326(-)
MVSAEAAGDAAGPRDVPQARARRARGALLLAGGQEAVHGGHGGGARRELLSLVRTVHHAGGAGVLRHHHLGHGVEHAGDRPQAHLEGALAMVRGGHAGLLHPPERGPEEWHHLPADGVPGAVQRRGGQGAAVWLLLARRVPAARHRAVWPGGQVPHRLLLPLHVSAVRGWPLQPDRGVPPSHRQGADPGRGPVQVPAALGAAGDAVLRDVQDRPRDGAAARADGPLAPEAHRLGAVHGQGGGRRVAARARCAGHACAGHHGAQPGGRQARAGAGGQLQHGF